MVVTVGSSVAGESRTPGVGGTSSVVTITSSRKPGKSTPTGLGLNDGSTETLLLGQGGVRVQGTNRVLAKSNFRVLTLF